MEEHKTEILNDPNALNFQPGEIFAGRYQIVEQIGQGGMGKVFKAIDKELSETVALKMIRPELSKRAEIIERFKRELQMARKINHPNVIRIHDLGLADGIHYISMKYIDGQSLKDLIRISGKLTVEKTVDIASQVAEALSAAHDNGIVHRDLKPQNIMLDRKGHAYVLDFGIARSVNETSLTGTGIIIGTPDFMSPEQIHNGQADARTDIYSFGIILYEMVTGRLPFVAEETLLLLQMHLHEKPAPPSRFNSNVPKWLESIILKCLEKKPEDRYANIAEIKNALTHSNLERLDKKDSLPKKFWPHRGKSPKRENKKWTKVVVRALIIIIFFYASASLIGFIVDGIYDKKLKELIKDINDSFANRFPIEKTYIPASWEKHDCDAWQIYHELSPPKIDPSRSTEKNIEVKNYTRSIVNNKARNQLDALVDDYVPTNIGQMQLVLNQLAMNIRSDELNRAVSCSRLVYPFDPEDSGLHNLLLQLIYAKYSILQARVDFLGGKQEDGLRRINSLFVFSLDTLLSAKFNIEGLVAIGIGRKAIQDILPFLLDPNFQPVSINTQEMEELLHEWLQKLQLNLITSIIYTDIITARVDDLYGTKYYPSEKNHEFYHFFGKFAFWRTFFSDKKFYFDQLFRFEKLRSGFSQITKPDKIRKFFKQFLEVNFIAIQGQVPIESFFYKLHHCRTLAKLALLLLQIRRYGFESREFANFKTSEYFINEITGSPFVMIKKEDGTILIAIDQNLNFPIRLLPYRSEYLFTLKSFEYLNRDKLVLEGLD